MFALMLAAQVAGPTLPISDRGDACERAAVNAPRQGETLANQWIVDGGGYQARECLGLALANQQRWRDAASAFSAAATEAEDKDDVRAANLWALAGNAWLAEGVPDRALTALDKAIAKQKLEGLTLGEAHLDRARARVSGGDEAGAREDLDIAVRLAAADPFAWLLSATLARRMGDLPRAHRDIAEAVRLAGDDPAVQLELGNIAAVSGNADGARTAWERVITLAPGTARAATARQALAQFDTPTDTQDQ
ncbi:tetratricopeptide repeat protein [Sphingosinithalassobacter portus]|uniref:tetratricopeptide repeat protein n=1 Tax=Stakelama portus TaxID=2676234 RepID=UPI000D6E3D6D|nr:tetratricopeptide repeat protein [Sphingosinithalassobacter portus]